MGQEAPGTGEGNEEQVKGGGGGGGEAARGAVSPGLGARESAQSDCPAESPRTTLMGLLDKGRPRGGGTPGVGGHLPTDVPSQRLHPHLCAPAPPHMAHHQAASQQTKGTVPLGTMSP